eukprot:g4406.t1
MYTFAQFTAVLFGFWFDVQYFLYTRTFVGRLLHAKLIAKSREKGTHTTQKLHEFNSFSVREVALLSDNYCYLLVDHETGYVAAIDPCDAERVAAEFNELQREWADEHGGPRLSLKAILTTHYHHDHAGGNEALAARFPGLTVVGGHAEPVPAATLRLGDGEQYSLGATRITALHTPCHTRGHMCFLADHTPAGLVPDGEGNIDAPSACFTGDCLFVGGCGRFFEGGAADMARALGTGGKLAMLPRRCRLFCGHEYTVSNLQFAAWLEPENGDIAMSLSQAEAQREAGESTMPSTVAAELLHNPFMRCADAAVACAVARASAAHAAATSDRGSAGGTAEVSMPLAPTAPEVQVMVALRRLKDAGAHTVHERAQKDAR